jgi:hypothetical protein
LHTCLSFGSDEGDDVTGISLKGRTGRRWWWNDTSFHRCHMTSAAATSSHHIRRNRSKEQRQGTRVMIVEVTVTVRTASGRIFTIPDSLQ